MKALVGAFNQEKALEGAFSVIVKTDCETDGSFYSTNSDHAALPSPGVTMLLPVLYLALVRCHTSSYFHTFAGQKLPDLYWNSTNPM